MPLQQEEKEEKLTPTHPFLHHVFFCKENVHYLRTTSWYFIYICAGQGSWLVGWLCCVFACVCFCFLVARFRLFFLFARQTPFDLKKLLLALSENHPCSRQSKKCMYYMRVWGLNGGCVACVVCGGGIEAILSTKVEGNQKKTWKREHTSPNEETTCCVLSEKNKIF